MDTLHHLSLFIIAVHGFPDEFAGAGRRLVHLGQQAYIGTADMRYGFAQSATREHITVAEHIYRINKQDIHITLQLPMLEAIIQNGHFRTKIFDGILPRNGAVSTNQHRNFRQMLGQHECLVPGISRRHMESLSIRNNADIAMPLGPVAAIEDYHAIAHIADVPGQPLCSRGLARAAHGDIAEADDETIQFLLAEDAIPIPPKLNID